MRGAALGLAVVLIACAGSDGDDETTASTVTTATTTTVGSTTTLGTSTGGTTGGSTGTGTVGSTGSTGGSGSSGGVDCTALPELEPSWMLPYMDDVVAKLAGADELLPGVTVSDRSTPINRQRTRDFLTMELQALGYDPMDHAYSASGENVFAQLDPDGDPDGSILVFGAHFDSVPGSPGANDNATGVAMVLTAARWLADVPCRTRGVVFVLFDEEEDGLLGSDAFAALLQTQGLAVHSAHTVDQMGWDADADRALELERPDAGLYEAYEATANDLGMTMALTQTQTGFTDHVSFRDHGFEAIGITEEFVSGDTTPHYHLPSDVYDTVDVPYLVSTTKLVQATLAGLARG